MKLLSLERLRPTRFHAVYDVGEYEVVVEEVAISGEKLLAMSAPSAYWRKVEKETFETGAAGSRAITGHLFRESQTLAEGEKRTYR